MGYYDPYDPDPEFDEPPHEHWCIVCGDILVTDCQCDDPGDPEECSHCAERIAIAEARADELHLGCDPDHCYHPNLSPCSGR